MAHFKKQISARVMLPSGEYVATWEAFRFQRFTKELNGGLGECELQLGVPFDYDRNDLQEGNIVELYVVDKETVAGGVHTGLGARMVYRGYISEIRREVGGDYEGPVVYLLGFYTLLSMDILKSGAQTTLYSNSSSGLTTTAGSLGAADIATIVRAVVTRYQAETTAPRISAGGAFDIPATGTSVTYTFEQHTYRDALDKLKIMAPSGVYWYVNADGTLSFKQKPSTPTHRFVLGAHFSDVSVRKTLTKVRNVLLLYNGDTGGSAIYKQYSDAASIAKYGRRVETVTDTGITASNAADAIGSKFLAESAQPDVHVVCRIQDSNGDAGGYDIESIEPGDTCDFVGFSETLSDIFSGNALITRVTYMLDAVELEVELVPAGLTAFQEKQQRSIMQLETTLGMPASYTT